MNNQVSSASEARNLKVEVIMFCVVSAATHQKVQWYVIKEKCWIHEHTQKTEQTWRKNLFQCLFIHHESHTKWCKIQLQLYSQKTAPNDIRIQQYSFEMCTAKLYGHSTDTALCIDPRTNIKHWKVQQLTYSGYQELQHHLLTFIVRTFKSVFMPTVRSFSVMVL
jgi:hypothetical protein